MVEYFINIIFCIVAEGSTWNIVIHSIQLYPYKLGIIVMIYVALNENFLSKPMLETIIILIAILNVIPERQKLSKIWNK